LPKLFNNLRYSSSRRLKREFPEILLFWSVRKSTGVLWAPSDFAESVGGASLSLLKQCIEDQGRG
jgi:putative transposase